jgi:hypothetical protein
MGRIVDLCGEVAAAADEGENGLVLPPEAWDRLGQEWEEEDIEDAMSFVKDSLLQGELIEASDSLSAWVLDILRPFGTQAGFDRLSAGQATISVEAVAGLARRLERLEGVLEGFGDTARPDRRAFDALKSRLMDLGIEKEMWGGDDDPDAEDEEEEEKGH